MLTSVSFSMTYMSTLTSASFPMPTFVSTPTFVSSSMLTFVSSWLIYDTSVSSQPFSSDYPVIWTDHSERRQTSSLSPTPTGSTACVFSGKVFLTGKRTQKAVSKAWAHKPPHPWTTFLVLSSIRPLCHLWVFRRFRKPNLGWMTRLNLHDSVTLPLKRKVRAREFQACVISAKPSKIRKPQYLISSLV